MLHERAQAGGTFLPNLLKEAGLIKEEEEEPQVKADTEEPLVKEDAESAEGRKQAIRQRYEKTDEAILELNVVLVYKKAVQGLIYSPPDCDKYLGLDAEPQGSVALAPTLATGLWHQRGRAP
eukprot:scaffold20955_cov66-Phaeocystis_antarctica.AAC.7